MKKSTYLTLVSLIAMSPIAMANMGRGHFKEFKQCREIAKNACKQSATNDLTKFEACMQSFRKGETPQGITLSDQDASALKQCQADKAAWKAQRNSKNQ